MTEHRLKSSEERAILARLRTAEGHLRAIIAMLETDQPGEQVLHQLNAVQAALRTAGCILLHMQLERSLEVILHSSCEEQRQEELETCLKLFKQVTSVPQPLIAEMVENGVRPRIRAKTPPTLADS